MGGLPPVLRALPRAARAHGAPRHPALAASSAPTPTASRSISRPACCRGGRASTSGCCSHLYLHAAAQARHAGNEDEGAAARGPRISRTPAPRAHREPAQHGRGPRLEAGGHRVGRLRGQHELHGTAARPPRSGSSPSTWRRRAARRRWDLGANTGRYSRIAADAGRRVLAFDIDPAAAERNYRALAREGRRDILPLVLDLANPSPGLGWAGRERRSLARPRRAPTSRSRSPSSTTSRSRATCRSRCSSTCSRTLAPAAIVEFVPKDDPMVRRLLAARRDVFPGYTLDGFRDGRRGPGSRSPRSRRSRTAAASCSCSAADRGAWRAPRAASGRG